MCLPMLLRDPVVKDGIFCYHKTMTREPTILIGIPCLDHVKTPTVTSVMQMSSQMKSLAKVYFHTSSVVHESRIRIVKKAMASNCSHVMFIDSDMVFPPEAVDKLVNYDLDIVAGVYVSRKEPNVPNMVNRDPDNEKALKHITEFPKDKLFKVFAIGTGFMLIKTEVFKNLEEPWFQFGKWNGRDIGEDYYFCIKAGQKYDIWADPTIPLGHVGEYIYTIEDWEIHKEEIEKRQLDNDPYTRDVVS